MSLARKLLPAPLLSCALLALWLVLARSVSSGQVLIGLALGLGLPLLNARLRSTPVRIRRPRTVVRFVLIVTADVVISSFQVARGVLMWKWRKPTSGFVVIPLDLRAPPGLAALAIVTTIVPGTVWSELTLDGRELTLHVWDIGDDEQAFIARYKARYEAPLREIFE